MRPGLKQFLKLLRHEGFELILSTSLPRKFSERLMTEACLDFIPMFNTVFYSDTLEDGLAMVNLEHLLGQGSNRDLSSILYIDTTAAKYRDKFPLSGLSLRNMSEESDDVLFYLLGFLVGQMKRANTQTVVKQLLQPLQSFLLTI